MFKRVGMKLILVTGFISLISAFGFLTSDTASAAVPPFLKNDQVYKDISANQHYWWLNACFEIADIDKTTRNEVDAWDYFQGDNNLPALGAMYGSSSAQDQKDGLIGYRQCSSESVVSAGFNYLGYSNSRDTFCSIPGKQYDGVNADKTTCIAGSGDGDWDNSADKNIRAGWFRGNALKNKPALTPEGTYLRSYLSLINGCEVKFASDTLYDSSTAVPSVGDDNKYAVPVITETKSGDKSVFKIQYLQGVGTKSNNSRIALVSTSTGGVNFQSCNELANTARDNAEAYRKVIERLGYDSSEAVGGASTSDDKEDEGTSCGVEGVGWLICPAIGFIASLNDAAYGFLSDRFLNLDPDLTGPDTRAAWSGFRDIANVMFVIAFMLIIYSQITSAGISNYGLKKLLPKLVLVAVLVNISFFICQIAIDVSNIAGNSIVSLTGNTIPTISGDSAASGSKDLPLWQDVSALLLKGAIVGVGLVLLVAIGLPALLVFAMIVLILIARKALIILLVVASPIAFVAYLLPNTESIFKKWWGLSKALLLIYPIIGLVFGVSILAATIIASSDDPVVQVTALGVAVIPLFSVPILLKGALSSFGAIGSGLNKLSDRAGKRAMGNVKNGRSGEFLAAGQVRRRNRGNRIRTSKYNPVSKVLDSNGKIGQFTGGNRGRAAAQSGLLKAYGEEVDRQKSTMSDLGHEDLMGIVTNDKASVERRAAAAGAIGSRSFRAGHQELLDYVGREDVVQNGGNTIQTIQQQTAHDMKDQPLGMGDQDKGRLAEGKFSKATGTSASGIKRTVSEEAMLERLTAGKVSESSFASMNPDDLKLVEKLKSEGHLTPAAQTTIDNVIDRLRANPTVYAASKDTARTAHDGLHS